MSKNTHKNTQSERLMRLARRQERILRARRENEQAMHRALFDAGLLRLR